MTLALMKWKHGATLALTTDNSSKEIISGIELLYHHSQSAMLFPKCAMYEMCDVTFNKHSKIDMQNIGFLYDESITDRPGYPMSDPFQLLYF